MKKICAVLLAILSLAGCSMNEEIRMGTGDVGGNYYSYGTTLAQMIESDNEDITVRVRETQGSAANLRLLKEGYVNVAFTQSDILQSTYSGEDYSAIAGLYTEACQIIADADSDIHSVKDLYNKRVSLGEEESGVLMNAQQILSAYGLNESMLQASYLSFTDAAAKMSAGELDAFFCTAGAPTSAVAELARTHNVRLIAIDSQTADRIIEQYNGYSKCTIEAGTYKGQDEPVQTLGVKTVLLASNSLSADKVERITASIFANSDSLMFSAGGNTKPDIGFATEDIPIAFHEGAARYYAQQGVDVSNSAERDKN